MERASSYDINLNESSCRKSSEMLHIDEVVKISENEDTCNTDDTSTEIIGKKLNTGNDDFTSVTFNLNMSADKIGGHSFLESQFSNKCDKLTINEGLKNSSAVPTSDNPKNQLPNPAPFSHRSESHSCIRSMASNSPSLDSHSNSTINQHSICGDSKILNGCNFLACMSEEQEIEVHINRIEDRVLLSEDQKCDQIRTLSLDDMVINNGLAVDVDSSIINCRQNTPMAVSCSDLVSANCTDSTSKDLVADQFKPSFILSNDVEEKSPWFAQKLYGSNTMKDCVNSSGKIVSKVTPLDFHVSSNFCTCDQCSSQGLQRTNLISEASCKMSLSDISFFTEASETSPKQSINSEPSVRDKKFVVKAGTSISRNGDEKNNPNKSMKSCGVECHVEIIDSPESYHSSLHFSEHNPTSKSSFLQSHYCQSVDGLGKIYGRCCKGRKSESFNSTEAKAYIPENVIDLSASQTVDLLNANKGVLTEKDSLRLIDDCKCLEMQSRHSTPDHDAVREDPSIKYLFKHQTSSASQKIYGATNHVCCDASSPKVRPNIDHNLKCDADERDLDVASTQHCYHYHNMTRPAENILSSSFNFNTRSNLQCSDRYCQSHTGWPLSRVDGSRFNFNDDCKASASTLNNLSAYQPRTSNVGVKSSRGFGENFGGIDSDTASVCSHVCRSCGTQLMNTLSDLNSKPRNDLSIPEVPSEESNDDCSIMKGVQKETILSTLSLSTSSGNHSLKSAIQKFVCKKMKYPTKELSGISLRKSKHSASFLRMCATLANRAGITRPALPASLSSDGIATPCSTSANFDLGPLNLTPINSNFSSNGERSSCSVDQRQKSTLTHRYQKATSESSFQIFLGQNALLKDSAECIASKSTDSGAVTRESCSTRGTMPRPWTCSNVAERKAIEKSLQSESSLLSHLHDSRLRKHQEIEELEAVQTVHTQIDYIHCLVPDLLTITGCSFYWGKMDRYEAETLLENRPEGTFLLRDSAQTDYLFSVSFRRYGKSLHARIEQGSHKFSFDSHDPDVFASDTVCGLIQHYKDPSCCMFFEPMLTVPLSRTFPFPLQHLCRATICSATTYDGINKLRLPKFLRNYLREYHYKQLVRIRRFDH